MRFAVQSLLRVLDEEQRAFEEENRVLFYDITRALTRVALGYAYEKGYVTGNQTLIRLYPIMTIASIYLVPQGKLR